MQPYPGGGTHLGKIDLTCPQGHHWEACADGQGETTDWPPHCPVCGEAAVSGLPVVPGYELLAELGRGGMGVVYKALHVKLDRLVAVKVLPAELGRDTTFAERFTREARALAKLSHPHVITIHDFGQAGELSYFVMEFVEGQSLRQGLRSGRLPPDEAVQVARQVCDALQYAHAKGIVHRDIKPENILLQEDRRVKVADFGIAKLLTGEKRDYTLTAPWQVVGTLNYMAPEQIDNPLALDHRADIYSLGVVLYETLTGRLPRGRFEPPSQAAPVDDRLDGVVLKALEVNPDRRYQRASELQSAIDQIAKSPQPAEELPTWAKPEADVSGSSTPLFPRPPGPAERKPGALEPERVRQQVQVLAPWLWLSGVLHLLGGAGVAIGCAIAAIHQMGKTPDVFESYWNPSLLGAVGSLCGVVIIAGARKMAKLEAYSLARQAGYLALLPLSPGVLFGLPVGLWVLWTLLKPGVREAFDAQRPRAE